MEDLPAAPLTHEETQQMLRQVMERDELETLGQLARLGSVSAGIFTELSLTRLVLGEAYRRSRASGNTG